MNCKKKEKIKISFKRKIRIITDTIGFSIPLKRQDELRDPHREKTWVVTIEEE